MRNFINFFIVLGLIIPYTALAFFLLANGFNLNLLLSQIFASPGSTFFALDVLLSAVFVIYLAVIDKEIGSEKKWIILSALLIGPSFAFPLYWKFRNDYNLNLMDK